MERRPANAITRRVRRDVDSCLFGEGGVDARGRVWCRGSAYGRTGKCRNGINVVDPALSPSLHHPLPPPSSSVAVLAPPSNEDVGLFKMSRGRRDVGGPMVWEAYLLHTLY